MREPMVPAPRTAALRINIGSTMGSAAGADCGVCAAISAVADEVIRLQLALAARLKSDQARTLPSIRGCAGRGQGWRSQALVGTQFDASAKTKTNHAIRSPCLPITHPGPRTSG